MIRLVEQTARREGFGDRLAEGSGAWPARSVRAPSGSPTR